MSDHTTAIVPLSTWCFNSPDARAAGLQVDIGLLAESLIYYDRVAVSITTQPEFASWITWFVDRGLFDELLAMLTDGTIRIYDYAFATLAINKDGVHSLWNITDPIQQEPNTFERRVLYHESVQQALPHARHRDRLYRALRDRVIEVKSSDFDRAVENARTDMLDPRRIAVLLQAYVDELFRFRCLGDAPTVSVEVTNPRLDGTFQIKTNLDFDYLSARGGPGLEFHRGTPLNAAGQANKALWSAALMECDLFLGRPLSMPTCDKLFEGNRVAKIGTTVETLQRAVEFPDIRMLVNSGEIGWRDAVAIRRKAGKFRAWLQNEADRDRDAIVAYHHEVAKESQLLRTARKSVGIVGIVGGVGLAIAFPGPAGAFAGGVAKYVLEIASKIGADWRPVVFGTWMKARVEKLLA